MAVLIRDMEESDLAQLTTDFVNAYSHDMDPARFHMFLDGKARGDRIVVVAAEADEILGFCTLLLTPAYGPFRDAGIPEINALDVKPLSRKQGIATALVDELEARARELGHQIIGIGTGLYSDYGPAQRMYVTRGYVPDGLGITWGPEFGRVAPGDMVRADDDLNIWFTKKLQ